jgi:hypothetical protein
MKNRFLLLGMIILMLGTIFTSCMMTSTAAVRVENEGAFGQNLIIPAKDWESKGFVFVEKQYQITDKNIEGDAFTYQALLMEAQKVGADAIINIVIDKKLESVKSGMATVRQETWYGSALAIKYTTVLTSTTETKDSKVTSPVLNSSGKERNQAGGGSVSTEEKTGGLGGLFGGK